MQTPTQVAARNTTYKRIQITEVNTDKFYVEGVDGVGSPFRVEWSLQPSMVKIPTVGDNVIIMRIDNIWKIMWFVETAGKKTAMGSLKEGDIRIDGKRIFIDAAEIQINHSPMLHAEQIYNEVPTGAIDGINKVYAVYKPFMKGSVRVYLNGLRTIDFEETTANTFTMDIAPDISDTLIVDYNFDLMSTKSHYAE